ncbi:helix-turn-helix domain-containing protein [Flavobacterium sp. ARAG 55.4]|uniref:helix-turn-helix domain-containing protein n=1 Tax=Flavobacterium sp. ARAG 55.4 TaxID=3451357 RepID=UPI003F47D193
MKELQFRYHPIVVGLKINEDGSEIYLNGLLLKQFVNDVNRQNPTLKVNFGNRAHSVIRLVCEAWNGLSETTSQRASKINQLSNNHYSNLEWKEGASNGVGNFKQKLNATDVDEILQMIETGKSLKSIAQIYGVHQSTISRLRDKYVEKDK